MSSTLVTTYLIEMVCPTCAVPHAVPERLIEQAKLKTLATKTPRGIFCPNGHTWYITGPTEADKLRDQLVEAKKREAWADARSERLRQEAEAARRSTAAFKGVATRQRKLAAAAVCPVEGCHRTIQQMARHLRTKHPAYVTEHAHG